MIETPTRAALARFDRSRKNNATLTFAPGQVTRLNPGRRPIRAGVFAGARGKKPRFASAPFYGADSWPVDADSFSAPRR